MPNPRRGNTQIKKTANTKSNVGKPLPKKSDSAVKAAQTIKRETATKTTSNNRRTTQSNKRTYSTNSNNNIGRTSGKDYSKGFSNIKTKAKDYTKKVGNTIKREWNIDKVDKKEKKVNRVSNNHHGLTNEAKDIQNRALSGALEADNIFDKAFNPMGKFISNAMDSTIDNSLLGAGYTLATGKRMSDDAYYNNPYEEQRHQGISAGAGRMAGMAINYGLGRSAISPALDKATNAVMNGTRLGNAIKGSSVLGKIGQSVGTKTAQNIGEGLVRESISDATLGFGQNALINYGEGLRGEDFWKQQAKDTALDFLVGGTMEGVGIGKQIKGVNKATEAILSENPTRMLNPSISKEEYLADLWERMNSRMGTHNDLDNANKLRDAAYNKIDDLLEEYNKVVDMTPKQFNRYKLGRDLDTKNVKYYDAARGKTVKNAYEGDLETVKGTPRDQREKFGNRPKEGEAETVTVKAETPEPEIENATNETVTVNEPEIKEASPEIKEETPDKATSLKESQDAMNEINDALDNGDLDKARSLMDELDKKLTEIENNSGSKPKGKKGKTKEKGAKEAKPKKAKKETESAETVKQSEETAPKEKKTKIKESIKEDNGYKVGDKVVHKKLGKGEVIGFEEFTRNKKKYRNAVIRFEDGTEDVISHTNATETGFLKHADTDIDAAVKAEKTSESRLAEKADEQSWEDFNGKENAKDKAFADEFKKNIKTADKLREFWVDRKLKNFSADNVKGLSRDEATAYISKKFENDNDWLGWFRNEEKFRKPRIETKILDDKEMRNAGLNLEYQQYKDAFLHYDGDFDTFLNTPITLYRGSNSLNTNLTGDDVFLSFTVDPKIAKKFGRNGKIETITIKPIDTLGSYSNSAEGEVFVPRKTYEAQTPKTVDVSSLETGTSAKPKGKTTQKPLEKKVEKNTKPVTEQKVESTNEKKTLPTSEEVKAVKSGAVTSREALEGLTVKDLKSMANDNRITVKGTGANGNKLHSDYVDAIEKHFKDKEALKSVSESAATVAEEIKISKNDPISKLREVAEKEGVDTEGYSAEELYDKIIWNRKIKQIKAEKAAKETVTLAPSSTVEAKKIELPNPAKEYSGKEAEINGFIERNIRDFGANPTIENVANRAGKKISIDDVKKFVENDERFEIFKNKNGIDAVRPIDTTATTSGSAGTKTFTSGNDIPEPSAKKPLKQLRKNKNTELPKGETSKSKKPLSSNSSYQDIAEHFGDSETTKRLREVEEFISKWEGKDTAKAMETYLRSDKINPETKKIIMEMRENGEAFTKEVVTNKSVLEEAERRVKDDFDGTVAALFSKVKSGEQFTSQDMANASQISKKYMEQGDFRKAAEIQGELSTALSETGRFLQSQRYWRSLTPEGRVSAVVSSMRKLEKSRGMKKGTIRVGEEGDKLLKAIYEAKTNKELAEANKAFATYVWNQVPRTFAEKANAWRYLAMLGNPKTHIRNVLGNALFMPARKISDAFATAFEKAYSKKLTEFGGEATRRHAIINHFSTEDRALLKKAGENFKDDRDLLESISSKMFERQRAEGSSVFKTKYLDFLEKFNTKALNQEDVAFMALNYKSAYAQFCKANGVKASDITEEFAKKASEYAQDQALKATYRDSNALADALNKMRKNLIPKKSDDSLMKVGKRAGGFLMDSTIPFVRTPLNILKRGTLEYSPVGIARGLGRIAGASDANSLLKGIEYLSNGLTGTGVLALGMFLANRGVVNGSLGEWGKDKAYSQMLGEQDYSVNVGDKTITLDWVAPMSMPFFVGVEAATAMADGINGTEILESMSNISDPIFEMSMLQGIENNFNMAFSDKKGLGTIAKNAGFNYLSQFVPTLAGQIARTRVRDRKTVVSTSTDPFVKTLEKNFGKILNKVPIAGDVLNQDYVDLWGRTDSKENTKDYLTSGLENLFSPAYISKRNETAVDTELKKLYSKLGEEDKEKILPTFASNAFKQKFDDKEYNMTPAEFTQYKKTVGQTRYKGLEKLFKTSEYKNASDDEKRKMIESVYDDANNAGKKEYLSSVDKEFASAPDFYMLDEKKREKYDDSLNMSKQAWAKAYTAANQANNEVYRQSGLNLTNTERALVLAENGVTSLEQAKTIYKNISESAWDNGYKAHQLGKTVEDVQKEAIARENMTETERKFDTNFRSRSEIRYLGSKNAPVGNELYNEYLKVIQKVDKSNDDNGVIKQSEAQNAIDYLNEVYGLSGAQQAYLWYLSEGDDGWKKQPYGKWKG